MGMLVAPYRHSTAIPDDIPATGDFSITTGSPTTVDGTESLYMTFAGSSGTVQAIHGLMRTLPVGDFSVVTKLHFYHDGFNNNAGIIFRDTAGKYISIVNMIFTLTTPLSVVEQWTTRTSLTSNLTARSHGKKSTPLWLKASFNSATNDVEGFYSYTRDNWQSLGTSTFLATADAVGLGLIMNYSSGGAVTHHAWFEHWEVI